MIISDLGEVEGRSWLWWCAGTRVQDEKKKGGTPWGEGGQTKAPGNIYYKTLVTYLDIDRSAMRWRMF